MARVGRMVGFGHLWLANLAIAWLPPVGHGRGRSHLGVPADGAVAWPQARAGVIIKRLGRRRALEHRPGAQVAHGVNLLADRMDARTPQQNADKFRTYVRTPSASARRSRSALLPSACGVE